jgi:2-C-methyl-D-erythritol 4-phosphate cytidylyltransferase
MMTNGTTGRPRTVAVILAAGIGSRMGLEIPKQFVPVAGKTSLEHTVDTFEDTACIDEIIVMTGPDWLDEARHLLPAPRYPKVTAVLPGGSTRNETSRLALLAIDDPEAKVLFHDAVRPLIDPEVIRACVDALDSYDAVDTAIPSADTIVEVDEGNFIRAVPPRSALRRGQTPQGFRRRTLLAAYERAAKDPHFTATDDCSVVLKYLPGVPIFVVDGREANIKITHPIDIHLVDKLFQLRALPAPDAAPTALAGKVVVIFGSSSGIGSMVAERLARLGAAVVGCSRTSTGTHVEQRESVAAALSDAKERYGRVDHVVLTAGVLTVGPLASMTDEQLHHDVEVNLMAAFVVAQESYGYLTASQGSLLLYASSSYTRGRANYTVYSATKAAIVNLTQALADEWHDDRIRVNCISPSRTATPMRERAFGQEAPGSLLRVDAVAEASVRVLASEATGQTFDIRLPQTEPAAGHATVAS